jgi:hypothetical protein
VDLQRAHDSSGAAVWTLQLEYGSSNALLAHCFNEVHFLLVLRFSCRWCPIPHTPKADESTSTVRSVLANFGY